MARAAEPIAAVARINIASVKGLGLQHPDDVLLTERGAEADRRFHLIDADGRLLNGKHLGQLVRVTSRWLEPRLTLFFPDGVTVDEEITLGEPVDTQFYAVRRVSGKIVDGPFAGALSDWAGRDVRLVAVDGDGYATDVRPATMVSRATVERIGVPDARRYRMLLELEASEAFAEDGWTDGLVRVGAALLRVGGPVTRCVVTTQNPDTGVREVDTLQALLEERGQLICGVYADIVLAGRVRVGDPVFSVG